MHMCRGKDCVSFSLLFIWHLRGCKVHNTQNVLQNTQYELTWADAMKLSALSAKISKDKERFTLEFLSEYISKWDLWNITIFMTKNSRKTIFIKKTKIIALWSGKNGPFAFAF